MMILKVVFILTIALYVQGTEDAISEQRVVIHHHKFDRSGSLSEAGQKMSGNQEEYAGAYPSYEFSYKVNDPDTKDIKGQHETREGDEVTGNYWLIEPNGRKRTVNYQANDDKGFNAQVAFTAPLKDKESKEDSVINEAKEVEEPDHENDNDEPQVERNLDGAVAEIENNNDIIADLPSEPDNEEDNLNEENNQSDHENTTDSKKVSEWENFEDKENISENSQKATSYIAVRSEVCCVEVLSDYNKEKNENHAYQHRMNKPNISLNGKRRKLKRNKSQDQVPVHNINKDSQGERNGGNRPRQNNLEANENSNIDNYKKRLRNGNRKQRIFEKRISGNLNSMEKISNTNQDQNDRNANELRKMKMNNPNDFQNINIFSVLELTRNDDKLDHSFNTNKRDTYEHNTRIYHPKMTPMKQKKIPH